MDVQNSEYLDNLRHSAAHLLAAAVKELWPGTHNAIGPAIENGFYQDFDLGTVKLTDADFPKIEKRMRKILSNWKKFDFNEVSIEQARELFKDNPYKLEMAEEFALSGGKLFTNDPGNFLDLCKMGHVDNPSQELTHFKLLSVAGAYWKGDENNQMLTRIYGTAFPTQEELDAHLSMLEEAKLRDHRKIGKDLELFFIDEMVGKGLIMWLPKGTIVRDEVERYARDVETKAGYKRVVTPHIAKQQLFETSGHLPYYKEDMYPPMEMDDGTYYLRAMNCPHHHRIYQHSQHSYKDLPVRLAEYGMVYRNELSGTLAGLLRVRGMAMNDAHIYCTKDQIKDEFKAVMDLVMNYFQMFGFKDYWFRLSKWSPDRPEKYIQEPENWEYAQNVLRDVLVEMKVPFIEADNEAAFYGPKVDVQFKSVIGREESMSTIQLDFMAKNRFGLSYIDETGQENNDVFVIHRAPLSVHERFMAFLIEHYAGAFPTWLAPIQVAVIPVSDKHLQVTQAIHEVLIKNGIRTEHDSDNKTVSAKIRHWTLQKVPYMCIIGDTEAQKSTLDSGQQSADSLFVSVRSREGKDDGIVSLSAFMEKILYEINNRQTLQ